MLRPLLFLSGLWSLLAATAEAIEPFPLQELVPGVHVALQPTEMRFNDSNSTVLIGTNGVAVIDTQSSVETSERVLEAIRLLSGRQPDWLVNTHWHSDHTLGNSLYRKNNPKLRIVGHLALREDIPLRTLPSLKEEIATYGQALSDAEKQRESLARAPGKTDEAEAMDGRIERARKRLAYLQAAEIPGPDQAISAPAKIPLGEFTLHLIPMKAHTRGDLAVYIPERKVLITGDIADDLPYGGHGYPMEWLANLNTLLALDFDILIPGHGQVRRGKDHLRLLRDLMASVIAQTGQAVQQGLSLEATQKAVRLDKFRERLVTDEIAAQAFGDFMPATVERAWREARGEKLD